MHPIIVVEGLDAVGKTTLSRQLAAALGAERIACPPPLVHEGGALADLRAHFDGRPESIRRAYYRFGNLVASEQARIVRAVRPVVLDRYWPSTVAFAVGADPSHELAAWVGRYPDDLLIPDALVLLEVDEATRAQRMTGRGEEATREESAGCEPGATRPRHIEPSDPVVVGCRRWTLTESCARFCARSAWSVHPDRWACRAAFGRRRRGTAHRPAAAFQRLHGRTCSRPGADMRLAQTPPRATFRGLATPALGRGPAWRRATPSAATRRGPCNRRPRRATDGAAQDDAWNPNLSRLEPLPRRPRRPAHPRPRPPRGTDERCADPTARAPLDDQDAMLAGTDAQGPPSETCKPPRRDTRGMPALKPPEAA
ncbi:MAG: AAA family ATPase [Myxococcota bacterium]